MSMGRNEALAMLAADDRPIPDDQEFVADRFQPRDAYGVARLFYAVYGDGYPIDTYYIPERLVEENQNGTLRSLVSRTASGDVVSHVAFYRGSAPNPGLYEFGLGLTLPGYRSTTAFCRVSQLAMGLVGSEGIDGIFGEAVCNHVITQKLSLQSGMRETALEPALMPARAYDRERSAPGRVGCLFYFRGERDRRRKLHIPPPYREELTLLLDGLNLDRELIAPNCACALPAGQGEIEVKRFDFAGVARCTVTQPGEALGDRLRGVEEELRGDDYAIIQFFVDLGHPWSGGVVELLRSRGYCFGGLLPTWFGSDGLLLQKHLVDPDLDGMKIHSPRGRQLLELVRQDRERNA
jgi:hypothetical protein